jgi:MFS family permease
LSKNSNSCLTQIAPQIAHALSSAAAISPAESSLSSSLALSTAPAPEQLHRDLRSIAADGVFYSVMVGLGETYVPAFVLALGHGAQASALITTLPLMLGALAQLAAPFGARRGGSYRRWVVGCARAQAACFLPLVAAALGAPLGLVAIFAVMAAYWGFSLSTGPAWNAWVETLVPAERRARYFATRSRLANAALLGSLLAASLVLFGAQGTPRALPLFAALFACACAARFASANFLARQSERAGLAREHDALTPLESLRLLRGTPEARLLLAMLGLTFATYIAAPFFVPYMLGPVGLDYTSFTLVTATVFAARIGIAPVLGRIAARVGVPRILAWGAVGVTPLPALWLVSHDLRWLLALQVISGAAWGAYEYATLLTFFERIDARSRTSVLSLYNAANSAAMALGNGVGALAFGGFATSLGDYALVMALSAAARLAVVPYLRHAPAVPAPPRGAIQQLPLAVRPGAEGELQPVLATVPDPPAAPDSEEKRAAS